MKKIIIIAFILITVISASVFGYRYTQRKYSDINYAVERYVTTGLFNSHKLYKVNDMALSFSDSNIAVMNVSGLYNKPPHNLVKYKIFLEKNKNGLWKVVRIYSD